MADGYIDSQFTVLAQCDSTHPYHRLLYNGSMIKLGSTPTTCIIYLLLLDLRVFTPTLMLIRIE